MAQAELAVEKKISLTGKDLDVNKPAEQASQAVQPAQPKVEQPKPEVAQPAVVDSGWQVGQSVRITAERYSTGEKIPNWVKEKTHSIQQVGKGKMLIAGIYSWVPSDGLVAATDMPAQDAASQKWSVGQRVQITGARYSTGQKIPNWVKAKTHTIQQLGKGKALIAGIYSWVNYDGIVPATDGPVQQSDTANPVDSAIGVGSAVRIVGTHYATGQKIPQWVKERVYTVTQMGTGKALMSKIISWVKLGDLELVSGGQVAAPAVEKPVEKKPAPAEPMEIPVQAEQIEEAAPEAAPTAAEEVKPTLKPGEAPVFSQSDEKWGDRILGKDFSISDAGCAMTAVAMAISMITGQYYTPEDLDKFLDANNGYSGDDLKWSAAAKALEKVSCNYFNGFMVNELDAQISSGNPAIIGGDCDNDMVCDHWICVVGYNEDGSFKAHDPAGGKIISVKRDGRGGVYWKSGLKEYTALRQCNYSKMK